MSSAPHAQLYHLPRTEARERVIERLSRVLARLPMDRAWVVTVAEHKPKRSLSQNNLMWSLYDQIIERGGEAMRGWSRDDLHTFFLMQHFGEEVREIFGQKRRVPRRTSSGLNKQEMSDYIESIVMFMAERGVVLDLPEDAR